MKQAGGIIEAISRIYNAIVELDKISTRRLVSGDCIMYVLKLFDDFKNIEKGLIKVEQGVNKLIDIQPVRVGINTEFIAAGKNKEFLNRVVTIKNGDSIYGSAFVVGEVNGYYILFTNSHVVGTKVAIELLTNEDGRKLIGTGYVVIHNYRLARNIEEALNSDYEYFPDYRVFHEDYSRDIAIVVIRKEESKLALKPINLVPEFQELTMGSLISGYNDTLSTGTLIRFGDFVMCLGAQGIDGDSGSPYLIDEDTAVAVNYRSSRSFVEGVFLAGK